MIITILLFLSIYIGGVYLLLRPFNDYRVFAAGYIVIGLFLLSQYIYGKKVAINSVKATPWEDPVAEQITRSLSKSMGIKQPKIMIGNFGAPNAFAVGRKNSGVVVVSKTLVNILNPEELEAVIAHEISHLRSRDTIVMLLGHTMDVIVLNIIYRAAYNTNSLFGTLFGGVVVVLGTIIRGFILIPLRFISRKREYVADYDSVKYSHNSTALASALRRINQYHVDTESREPPEINALSFWSSSRSIVERLFGTHPPVNKRINKIYAHAEELSTTDKEQKRGRKYVSHQR